MLALALLLSSLLPLATSSPLVVREDVGGGTVFDQASFAGNGCPDNSASISGNWNTAIVRFDQFVVSTDQGVSGRFKNCGAHLTGRGAPTGWQVAVTESDLWGGLSLKEGSTFTWFTTAFRSENAAVTETIRGNITTYGGALTNPFSVHAESKNPIWSACVAEDGNIPGILNFNFRAGVSGPDQGGQANVDGAKLKFSWRKCAP